MAKSSTDYTSTDPIVSATPSSPSSGEKSVFDSIDLLSGDSEGTVLPATSELIITEASPFLPDSSVAAGPKVDYSTAASTETYTETYSMGSATEVSWETPEVSVGTFDDSVFSTGTEDAALDGMAIITSYVDSGTGVGYKKVNKKQYIDTNLVENSSDKLKNSLKGNYKLNEYAGGKFSRYEFQFFYSSSETKENKKISKTSTEVVFDYIALTTESTKVNRLAVNTLSIPMLMASNNTDITNDEEWRKIIIGGTYKNKTYPGYLNKGFSEDQVFECSSPYELRQLKRLVNEASTRGLIDPEYPPEVKSQFDFVEIKSHTNYSLPYYENYVQTLEETTIPNFYSMVKHNIFNSSETAVYATPTELQTADYYSLNGLYNSLGIRQHVVTQFPPPEDFSNADVIPIDATLGTYYYIDQNVSLKKYLNTFSKTKFDESVLEQVRTLNSSVLFPFGIPKSTNNMKKFIPYYNSIKIPARDEFFPHKSFDESLGDHIKKNIFMQLFNDNYSINICKALSKNFSDDSAALTKNFVTNEKREFLGTYSGGTFDTNIGPGSGTANLRYVDLFEMLTDETNLKLANSPDSVIAPYVPTTVSDQQLSDLYFDCLAANSNDDGYRYNKTIKSLKTLDVVFKMCNSSLWENNFSPFPAYNGDEIVDYYFDDFINSGMKNKYSETIGYRIKKTTASALTADRTPSTVQNIYVLHNKNAVTNTDHYEYIDTQIKKGLEYTYELFQYKLVLGFRYALKNPKVTRSIADPLGTDKNVYCLEFYDPYTLESIESNFDTKSDYKSDESTFDTGAQIISDDKFLAEATLEIEPVWRVYEIPLTNKSVQNTDHPPHALEVSPYQRKDDSQIIGFHLLKENFGIHDFPKGVNELENQFFERYLESQNLVKGEQISERPRAKIVEIEVFRVDKKPMSILDFNNALVSRKSLVMKKQIFDPAATFSDCFYEEKVKTNTKLYYTFRPVSSEGVKGSFSPIFESELVDDGNYKYAVFKKIQLADLEPENMHSEPSKDFKKLLQVIPVPNQLEIVDSGVDYTQDAQSQISNVTVGNNPDPIWDKKFKIRMTSKKTGKKIDVNITYKLRTST